ncbi:marginal zone B- and B1-cell-specific protein [Carettochelys insculpta]|uniref:marginal zone B- and B1-cell-specific protein n=1 Tax=Carettochelys insculpta TaxID=44489 RepID=UPI003EBA08E9
MKSLLAAVLLLSQFELRAAEDGKHSSCAPGDSGPVSARAFSASAPHFDAEEAYSTHMPQHLRCDACRVIAFQMQEHLAKAKSKRSSAHASPARLSESDYVEALEKCCSQSWDNYGVKEVGGVKRFAGPGLKDQETVSVMMMGGPWPARLYKLCYSYLGEFGEEQIYEEYRRQPDALAEFLCSGKQRDCARLSNAEDGSLNHAKAGQSEL